MDLGSETPRAISNRQKKVLSAAATVLFAAGAYKIGDSLPAVGAAPVKPPAAAVATPAPAEVPQPTTISAPQAPPTSVSTSITEAPQSAATINIPWLPPEISQYKSFMEQEAAAYGQDPEFVACIMAKENRQGNPHARHGGAIGLLQVIPRWAGLEVARHRKMPGSEGVNPAFLAELAIKLEDPRTNISIGTQYLAILRDMFDDRGLSKDKLDEAVIVAYNRGASAGRQYLQTGRGVDAVNEDYRIKVGGMYRDRHQPTTAFLS